MEETAGLLIAGIVMFVGLIGAFVPGIPGAPLILAAAVGHKLYFGEKSASYLALALLLLLTLLSLLLDFLGSVLGAKKMGATWRGVLGAMLGALVGIFFSLPGLILGPIVGAIALEMAGGRQWKESAQAGAGAFLGLLLGAVGKIVCCVIMIGVFAFSSSFNLLQPASSPVQAAASTLQHP